MKTLRLESSSFFVIGDGFLSPDKVFNCLSQYFIAFVILSFCGSLRSLNDKKR